MVTGTLPVLQIHPITTQNSSSSGLNRHGKHYLLALASQEAGDSLSCGTEFETAIQILNELSEYSRIDSF